MPHICTVRTDDGKVRINIIFSSKGPPWVWSPLRPSQTPGSGRQNLLPSGQTAQQSLPIQHYTLVKKNTQITVMVTASSILSNSTVFVLGLLSVLTFSPRAARSEHLIIISMYQKVSPCSVFSFCTQEWSYQGGKLPWPEAWSCPPACSRRRCPLRCPYRSDLCQRHSEIPLSVSPMVTSCLSTDKAMIRLKDVAWKC